ncbi:isopenicillin N synthase family oxygenase [Corticibacter populi]|uniref:2-oxoglutarate-dependent ethylene/succinate-forming enzyme n=1 Tax=Corticibacter populi TaxID=1550736 RepID=A0A3M6QQT4_9BURK|nr:2OG-Fe(II) oxygenase family protein [Corticibacter populi]RMX04919.1 isopenicillin N synthase family oxygenase [Corticibacter populi]RZS33656.1 isopenicillin N synthase-like dioxygenase [Corticibacter populi]
MQSIPLIDLQGNIDSQHPTADAVAKVLYEALSTIGFAYICGHNVDPAVRVSAFEASRRFHASDLALKQSLAVNAFHRGYIGMATETIRTSSVAKVTRPNMSESLMLMHELAADDPALLAGEPIQGPNQWPQWLPGFRPAIEAYIAQVDALGRYIIRLVAMGLDMPDTALDSFFEKPTTFLRLLHYPPQAPQEDVQMGSAPHTDYGVITLLAQDDSGGLQVRPVGGDWIEAPPIPNAYVLNVGDMLSRWTNGRLVSTPHRVINRSGGDRYSMPYFLDPNMKSRIECLPACIDAEHPPQFPPVVYGDYLMERLNRNHDYRKAA